MDVGANVGYFSLLASKLVGEEGSVVAIEPCPVAFSFLQENVKLNSLQNVSALQVAASDHEGELQLYWGDMDTAKATVVSSMAGERGFASSSRVHALPLSRILSEREIRGARVIKIDVEGHEAEVLLGMVPILDRCRNDLEIAVEVTPSAWRQRSTAEVLRPLTSRGFQLYEIRNDYSAMAYFAHYPPLEPIRLVDADFHDRKDLILSRAEK